MKISLFDSRKCKVIGNKNKLQIISQAPKLIGSSTRNAATNLIGWKYKMESSRIPMCPLCTQCETKRSIESQFC